jgi:hypothetical protein
MQADVAISLRFVAAFFVFTLSGVYAATSEDDHLLPLEEYGLAKGHPVSAYRTVWQKKLLVTPGNVARFAHIPGFAEPEAVICVNQRPEKSDGSVGGYWATRTEASSSLWNCIETGDEKFTKRRITDCRNVRVRRWDAPVSDSTAVIVRKLWLTMLSDARPLSLAPGERVISVDSPSEIFSAMSPEGKLLEAEAPTFKARNANELVRVGFLLLDYCGVSPAKRPQLAREIETRASRLLARVQPSKNSER